MTFESACSLVEAALTGSARRDIVEAALAGDASTAWIRLRDQMRSHRWVAAGSRGRLDELVRELDARTRREGLHVLHDWDGKADHVNADTIAADVATYFADRQAAEAPDRRALAGVLDYYFLYLLALVAARIWDDGDADANLDRVGDLVDRLQGEDGSGLRLVDHATTLFLVAGSHFEISDAAYDTLLARVRTLAPRHAVPIALTHAASLGCHLRFGIEATYNSDFGLMRDDNGVDYTWLGYSLVTLMRAYEGVDDGAAPGIGKDAIVEAMANGLSADATAFLAGRAPAAVAGCAADRAEFRERFLARTAEMTAAFEASRPRDGVYCPLALFFNFSQNVLKGIVVDAALWSADRGVSIDALFTAAERTADGHRAKLRLLDMLMGFARANPDRIRGRLMPVIVYDVVAGRRAFGAMGRAIKNS